MFSKKFLLPVAAAILLLIGAGYAAAHMSSNDLDPATHKDHNQILEEIGTQVPEFGGVYLSEDQTTLNVFMTGDTTDQDKREKTQGAIEDLLDAKPRLRLNIIKGDYNIEQLSDWYDTLRSGGVWDKTGVVTTDLHEGKNRLYVGVTNQSDIAGVQAFLDEVGIPREAVIIEVEPLETPKRHTLRDRAHNDNKSTGERDNRKVTVMPKNP